MSIFESIKNRIFQPKPVPFTAENYAVRDIYRPDYEILASAILKNFAFHTVMDIGCANGFLLTHFHAAQKDVSGIELSADALDFLPSEIKARVQIGDFSAATGSYDLVTCVEVAEHVPPSVSAALVEHVCRLAKAAVYFTAAPPGQPGHGHINCRPHQDWIDLFSARGWALDRDLTASIKAEINHIQHAPWLIENTLIFFPRK